jgi:hypothetical protein
MARIRSIKPEFWTSEQITECSPNARLMFIGLWNFCDDYGVHPASEKRLKMEVFPSDMLDSSDIRRMISELLANKLIEEYEVAESRYWRVTGWDRHQKIDCKTGLYPLPNGEVGIKIRRTNSERSCKEKEKEKEKEKRNGDFESFWTFALTQYRKCDSKPGNRKEAEKEWDRLGPDEDLQSTMREALEAQADARAEASEFVANLKHVCRWIKNECWNDVEEDSEEDNDPRPLWQRNAL